VTDAGGEDAEPPTVAPSYTVEVSGRRFDVKVIGPAFGGGAEANGAAHAPAGRRAPRRGAAAGGAGGGAGGAGSAGSGRGASSARGGGAGEDTLPSPIQGIVLKVAVKQGAAIEEGALVCVVEAMKMENEITAHKSGTIAELPIAVGSSVASGDTIAVITAPA